VFHVNLALPIDAHGALREISGSIQKLDQTKPGNVVSVDQIISAQPGLIPQMAGFLTSKQI
jgi:hypothetical protein